MKECNCGHVKDQHSELGKLCMRLGCDCQDFKEKE